jgi:hypothetical protein
MFKPTTAGAVRTGDFSRFERTKKPRLVKGAALRKGGLVDRV